MCLLTEVSLSWSDAVQGFGSGDYKVSSSGTDTLTAHFKQEADGSQTSAHRSLLAESNVMQPHHYRGSVCMPVCVGQCIHRLYQGLAWLSWETHSPVLSSLSMNETEWMKMRVKKWEMIRRESWNDELLYHLWWPEDVSVLMDLTVNHCLTAVHFLMICAC